MSQTQPVKQIGIGLLASIIRGVNGVTIATIFTETEPELLKTGNPYWDKPNQRWLVKKRAHTRIAIGGTYSGSVNTRRFKESQAGTVPTTFESGGRRWGQRLKGLGSARRRGKRASIVEYEGRLYLDVQRLQVLSVTYVGIDNVEIPATAIAPFIKQRGKSTTQDLEKEVDWRDYALTNVRQLRMDKMTFEVRLDAVASQERKAA